MRNLEEEDDALFCALKCPAHSFPQGSGSHCFQGLREGDWRVWFFFFWGGERRMFILGFFWVFLVGFCFIWYFLVCFFFKVNPFQTELKIHLL